MRSCLKTGNSYLFLVHNTLIGYGGWPAGALWVWTGQDARDKVTPQWKSRENIASARCSSSILRVIRHANGMMKWSCLCNLSPKDYTPNLNLRNQKDPMESRPSQNLTWNPQDAKAARDKKCLRNCHHKEEQKTAWQLDALACPRWNPRTEKRN